MILDELFSSKQDSYLVSFNAKAKTIESRFKVELALTDFLKEKGLTNAIYKEKNNKLYIVFCKKGFRNSIPHSRTYLKLDNYPKIIKQFEALGNSLKFSLEEETDEHIIISRPYTVGNTEKTLSNTITITTSSKYNRGRKPTFSPEDKLKISREHHINRFSVKKLSEMYGTSVQTIRNIVNTVEIK